VHLRQDLEAAVEDQLGVWIAGLDGADHAHQAGLLRRARRVVLGDELVRIERIEEETAVAPVPQRLDDVVDVESWPLGLGLVDHARGPGLVAAGQPGAGQVPVPAAVGRDLAHAHVGDPLGLGRLELRRLETMIGLDHDHVEGTQLCHGRLVAVVPGNIGRTHDGGLRGRQPLAGRTRRLLGDCPAGHGNG
jgi:hypothetical protein